jgi:cob(I)alamin adenosyltransferase
MSKVSITTKRGDDGRTDLLFGGRASKHDLRLVAVGDVDELNAILGLARLTVRLDDVREIIVRLQHDLVAAMGQVSAGPENAERYQKTGFRALTAESLTRVTSEAALLEQAFPEGHRGWATPGAAGLMGAAHLEVARTVCRRAERSIAAAFPDDAAGDFAAVGPWFNRVSDLLWLAARFEERPQP